MRVAVSVGNWPAERLTRDLGCGLTFQNQAKGRRQTVKRYYSIESRVLHKRFAAILEKQPIKKKNGARYRVTM